MSNGYYNLDVQTVNKAKQSAVAMAAYRSGDTLYSARDGLTRKYKTRPVEAENFILKPDHAPDWTLNRERLWNEVERYEARDNARIARSVLLSLPNDMTPEQQLELTKNFIQENFVDEGMVADTSIHREDSNNPHAHVLLTVRPFDAHGNWEPKKSKRVPILDDAGKQTYDEKGWRKTRSIKLTDWDDKATLQRWRENWAEKLNEASLTYGLNKTYTHESFEAQGRLEKPEIRLTRKEYQFEARKKAEAEKNNQPYEPVTHYGKKKAVIQAENAKLKKIVHLTAYKQEKDYRAQLDRLRSDSHVDDEKVAATQLLVERVKGYVDFQVAKNIYHDFNNERNKWKLNIERAESVNEAKKNLYSKLIEAYKQRPDVVRRYGYSTENFKEEIMKDLTKVKNDEQKVSIQKDKFDALKQASTISLAYQKELIDMEFASIYSDEKINDYSYEEKDFVLKLVKEHNIVLPEEKIKFECVAQNKTQDINKSYVPVWQQVKDTMTSIEIYERTINQFKQQDKNKLTSEQLKENLIKVNSFNILKSSYEKYLENIIPLIDQQIEAISHNKVLNKSNLRIKVAVLESYSQLSHDEQTDLNIEELVKNVEQAHLQQIDHFNNYRQNIKEDDEKISIVNDGVKKSQEIAEGLFDVLKSISQERNLSQDRSKRDSTKVNRKRGTDGRVL